MDGSNNYTICGIKYDGKGLLVWGKKNRIYCDDDDYINKYFIVFFVPGLSMWSVLNQSGLDAVRDMSGIELHMIRLEHLQPTMSTISSYVYDSYGNEKESNVKLSPSNLLAPWFTKYCRFVLNILDDTSTHEKEWCEYCHFKYNDRPVAYELLSPMKMFKESNDDFDEELFGLYVPHSIISSADYGNPDFGGGGGAEFVHSISYCPMCGRHLVPDFSSVQDYCKDNNLPLDLCVK